MDFSSKYVQNTAFTNWRIDAAGLVFSLKTRLAFVGWLAVLIPAHRTGHTKLNKNRGSALRSPKALYDLSFIADFVQEGSLPANAENPAVVPMKRHLL
jgi:hypothetical protein